ncbi:MAG: glycoside hydrolase N-terminal domain-containing protein [Oscillospiraceae bacterium]|nr:glycoside hydrolase N-terminal domain-containing protein [Oscillospiraceae bacterium]
MLKKLAGLGLAAAMILGCLAIGAPMAAVLESAAAEEGSYAPLKLWYDKPANEMPNAAPNPGINEKVWESRALPIGNGHIGGMIFGGVTEDRILVNEKTIWSGGPGKNQNYSTDIYNRNMPEQNDREPGVTYPRTRTQQQTRDALARLQRILQDNATEFTNRSKNPASPGNYPGLTTAQRQQNVSLLTGNKQDFGSYQQLSDIYIRDTNSNVPVMQNVSSSHTGTGGDATPNNLFDNNKSSKFYAGDPTNTAVKNQFPVTVDWDYNIPVRFESYSFISAHNDDMGRDPKAWELFGSTDGANYIKIDGQTDFEFSLAPTVTPPSYDSNQTHFHTRGETKTFTLAAPADYRYYRLVISDTFSGNPSPPQLAEIEMNAPAGGGPGYTNYQRGLDLDKGVAYETYTAGGVTYQKEYFTSYPGNIMAIRITASSGGKVNREIALTSPQPAGNRQISSSAPDGTITLTGRSSDQNSSYAYDKRLNYGQQLKVIAPGGTITAPTGSTLRVAGADEILILMAAGTNYQPCYDDSYVFFKPGYLQIDLLADLNDRIADAAEKGYEKILEEHLGDYTELFSRVKLDLCGADFPDKNTAALMDGYRNGSNSAAESRYVEVLYYQFGRYLLIGSSREDSLPANLQGIWAEGTSPPWAADYHTNINVQMNYWLAQQTNLGECHQSMIDYTRSLVPRGTETALFFHQKQDGSDVRGWTTYHENNIWGYSVPAVSGAFYCPTAAAWLCQDMWEQYAFTMDELSLAKNYDTMLQAALFWVDFLWVDERDGYLVANPSYSPEHGPLTLGASSEQLIIWQNFEQVIEAAKVLGRYDTPEIEEIRQAQARLWLPRIGVHGQYLEWKDETNLDISEDNEHRHVNHLQALHPGNLVVAGRSDVDNQYVEAMKTVLYRRGDGGTGWSKAWKINFWARCRDGDHSGKMVSEILKESTYYNLFDTHTPFQIDGNFGATSGMTEMLLQSQGGSIDLLPSLPSAWSSGSLKGLKARGNFEIGMSWSGRVLDTATIQSLSGEPCTVRYPKIGSATVKKSDGSAVAITVKGESYLFFNTEKGETYTITVTDRNIGLQTKKEYKPEASYKLLGANLKNLYSDEVLNAVKAPADIYDDGVFAEYFEPRSFLYNVGLRKNDVITKINGYLVTGVGKFQEIYTLIPAGQDVILKVWRGTGYIGITFKKGGESALPAGKFVPAPITAVDWSAAGNINNSHVPQKNGGCGDPGYSQNIGNVEGNDWVRYDNVQFLTGTNTITLSCAHPNASATTVTVFIDPANNSPTSGAVATASVVSTGGWQTYQAQSFTLNTTVPAGSHSIYLRFSSSVNISWLSFDPPPPDGNYIATETPAGITGKLDFDYANAWIARAEKFTDAVLADSAYDASRDTFKTKLAAAKSAAAGTNQAAIITAGNELKDLLITMDGLYSKTVMKGLLDRLAALNLVQAQYTSKSWTPYNTALTAAQGLQANPAATAVQLEKAAETLNSAFGKLVRKGSMAILTNFVNEVKDLKQADYPQATAPQWAIFTKALTAAQSTLTTANGDIDQIGVNDKLRDLQVAAMLIGYVIVLPEGGDKDALQALADSAGNIINIGYTDLSWNRLTAAFNAAQEVLANPTASQNAIDAALADLSAAIDTLRKWGFVDSAPGKDRVTITDARLILQNLVGKITTVNSDPEAWAAAAVNGDKNQDGSPKVTITDARLILQYLVGKIDNFPAEL